MRQGEKSLYDSQLQTIDVPHALILPDVLRKINRHTRPQELKTENKSNLANSTGPWQFYSMDAGKVRDIAACPPDVKVRKT